MRIIDVHGHCHRFRLSIEATKAEDLIASMREFNIEKCAISSAYAICYDMEEGNAGCADITKRYDELFGYVVVNANYVEDSIAEMEKYLPGEKFLGIKMHPEHTGIAIDSPGSFQLLKLLSERWPHKVAEVHCWGKAQVDALMRLANAFPRINFIMVHMGGNDWKYGGEQARDHRNVYPEISCSIVETGKVDWAVKQVGSERVLFGSDLNLLSPALSLGLVLDADISEADRENILYNNALKLFPVLQAE